MRAYALDDTTVVTARARFYLGPAVATSTPTITPTAVVVNPPRNVTFTNKSQDRVEITLYRPNSRSGHTLYQYEWEFYRAPGFNLSDRVARVTTTEAQRPLLPGYSRMWAWTPGFNGGDMAYGRVRAVVTISGVPGEHASAWVTATPVPCPVTGASPTPTATATNTPLVPVNTATRTYTPRPGVPTKTRTQTPTRTRTPTNTPVRVVPPPVFVRFNNCTDELVRVRLTRPTMPSGQRLDRFVWEFHRNASFTSLLATARTPDEDITGIISWHWGTALYGPGETAYARVRTYADVPGFSTPQHSVWAFPSNDCVVPGNTLTPTGTATKTRTPTNTLPTITVNPPRNPRFTDCTDARVQLTVDRPTTRTGHTLRYYVFEFYRNAQFTGTPVYSVTTSGNISVASSWRAWTSRYGRGDTAYARVRVFVSVTGYTANFPSVWVSPAPCQVPDNTVTPTRTDLPPTSTFTPRPNTGTPTATIAPCPPSGLTWSSSHLPELSMYWTNPTGVQRVRVYLFVNGSQVASRSGLAFSQWTLSNVQAESGDTAYFRVETHCGGGVYTSRTSSTVTLTGEVLELCPAPDGLWFPTVSDSNVTIAWDAVDVLLPEAHVDVSPDAIAIGGSFTIDAYTLNATSHWFGLSFTTIAQGSGNLNYVDTVTDAIPGTYLYRARADSPLGQASDSDQVVVTDTRTSTHTPTRTPTETSLPTATPTATPAHVGGDNILTVQFHYNQSQFGCRPDRVGATAGPSSNWPSNYTSGRWEIEFHRNSSYTDRVLSQHRHGSLGPRSGYRRDLAWIRCR